MKLKFKAIAAAAAFMAAGAAHADLIDNFSGNSSIAMVAFNVVTNSFYVRDLGYRLNSFLPSSITTAPGDGGVTGDKTPEAGLNISWASDATWASWISAQTAADVRWTVAAGDGFTTAGTSNLSRALGAIFGTPAATSNLGVRGAASAISGASALITVVGPMGYSATGPTVPAGFLSNNSLSAPTLGLLDAASSLYYFVTTTGNGSNAAVANKTQFGNSAGAATLTLASNGVLTYDLQPGVPAAVPLPGSIWMMGVGMLAVGGMLRRRKAAQA